MPVVSVSQLNNYMKRYVDQNTNLSELWVCGEISNYKMHYTGHVYMSLKDNRSSLRTIIFNQYVRQLNFSLKDGMRVIAFGKVSVFERDGSYQLYVEKIIPDGTGELYAAYEQLKSKLSEAGLFSCEAKRALPYIPYKIGIVTSLSGAAVKDIVSVLKRRFPLSQLCIYPAKVQGIGAGESICDGIDYLEKRTDCDVIIIARGGGSIEDLWAFNEERVAYAIYNCSKPIISAVGHETDYTIADFVADKRAPTPSAAAEVAVPQSDELKTRLQSASNRINYSIRQIIALLELKMRECSMNEMHLKELELCNQKKIQVDEMCNLMNDTISDRLSVKTNTLALVVSSLESMNPLKVLQRGYSVISNHRGDYVSPGDLKADDVINVRFSGGELECTVRRVIYENK